MKLITKEQQSKMLDQGRANAERAGGIDFPPVVKLFTPDANATWLLTEIDPENPDLAFGLCDLGHPELGWVSLAFAQAWIHAEAAKPEWQAREASQRQMSLF